MIYTGKNRLGELAQTVVFSLQTKNIPLGQDYHEAQTSNDGWGRSYVAGRLFFSKQISNI
ncbi:hypothetical protein GCM10007385_04070 [Tateyamaria omphalii]|nr:hypothetical protein GCM10007385_04070 [Tateyamaria omphalii]